MTVKWAMTMQIRIQKRILDSEALFTCGNNISKELTEGNQQEWSLQLNLTHTRENSPGPDTERIDRLIAQKERSQKVNSKNSLKMY